MIKKTLRTKIEVKLNAIPSPILAAFLCIFSQPFPYFSKGSKVPSLGLKEGIYRLGSEYSLQSTLFFFQNIKSVALRFYFGQPRDYLPVAAPRSRSCGAQPRVGYYTELKKFPFLLVLIQCQSFSNSSSSSTIIA